MPDLADDPNPRFLLARREEFEAITRPLVDIKTQIYMRAKFTVVCETGEIIYGFSEEEKALLEKIDKVFDLLCLAWKTGKPVRLSAGGGTFESVSDFVASYDKLIQEWRDFFWRPPKNPCQY